jgi:LacI family transcriptional regulator
MRKDRNPDSLPDIYSIAKRAGVSPATVSNIFHNRQNKFSPETAKKVLKIAREVGYKPNALASSLASRRSYNIGLVYHPNFEQISNVFYNRITESVVTELTRIGYKVSFSALGEHDRLPDIVQRKDADGLIIIPFIPPLTLNDLRTLRVPAVLLTVHTLHEGVDCVRTDNENGIRKAIEHLKELGHTEIGFISHSGQAMDFQERLDAFCKYFPDAPREFIKVGRKKIDTQSSLYESGYERGLLFAAMKHRPTAILCANDQLAIGAMKALQERGISIPRDISVVGFDDIEWAVHASPPLTTLRSPRQQMGVIAVNLLTARIADPGRPFETRFLDAELVVRESTAKV